IATAEVFGQVHAVVGALRLFTEQVQPVVGQGAALDQLFDTVMAHHAVADDDEVFLCVRGSEHGYTSALCVRRRKMCKRNGAWSRRGAPGAVAWYSGSGLVNARASLRGLPSPSPGGRAINADRHGSLPLAGSC